MFSSLVSLDKGEEWLYNITSSTSSYHQPNILYQLYPQGHLTVNITVSSSRHSPSNRPMHGKSIVLYIVPRRNHMPALLCQGGTIVPRRHYCAMAPLLCQGGRDNRELPPLSPLCIILSPISGNSFPIWDGARRKQDIAEHPNYRWSVQLVFWCF